MSTGYWNVTCTAPCNVTTLTAGATTLRRRTKAKGRAIDHLINQQELRSAPREHISRAECQLKGSPGGDRDGSVFHAPHAGQC